MLIILLCLSIEAYASDAAYRKLEADKHVSGLLSMLQARRQHSGVHGLRYCARLSADCKENNRLQRRLGPGCYLSYRCTYTAANGMWPIHAFQAMFSEDPGYTESHYPRLRKFGADYDGHFWTVVIE